MAQIGHGVFFITRKMLFDFNRIGIDTVADEYNGTGRLFLYEIIERTVGDETFSER